MIGTTQDIKRRIELLENIAGGYKLFWVPNSWAEFLERVAYSRECSSELILHEAILEYHERHWPEANL